MLGGGSVYYRLGLNQLQHWVHVIHIVMPTMVDLHVRDAIAVPGIVLFGTAWALKIYHASVALEKELQSIHATKNSIKHPPTLGLTMPS